jgi:hypothetical protein
MSSVVMALVGTLLGASYLAMGIRQDPAEPALKALLRIFAMSCACNISATAAIFVASGDLEA